MRILYLPLDERPCNYRFPALQLPHEAGIVLVRPERALLGAKKRPAPVDRIYDWLENELPRADRAILSVEMLLYGGLLPSRIHTLTSAEWEGRIDRVTRILARARGHGTVVAAFGMIMRTPDYSSSEEEPDYYAEYGSHLFTRGYLHHKREVAKLSRDEQKHLRAAATALPGRITDDYDRRRALNLETLKRFTTFLEEGLVARLILPEDDTAPYGYGPREKRELLDLVRQRGLQAHVLSYPGADEVGLTMVAAAALGASTRAPRIAPVFFDDTAEAIVPKYEGRPLGESVRAQIRAVGGLPVATVAEADIVAALYTGEAPMTDAWLQEQDDGRREREGLFLDRVFSPSEAASPRIVIADCAYANGGSTRLVLEIEARHLWREVVAYAGWNTSGNTIGTALAAGVLQWRFPDEDRRLANLVYRIADDWIYQSVVRSELTAAPSSIRAPQDRVAVEARSRIEAVWAETFGVGTLPAAPGLSELRFPWRRLFEVDLDIDLGGAASHKIHAQSADAT